MSSPTDMPSQYTELQQQDPDDPFVTDYAQMQADTETYNEAVAEQQQAQSDYGAYYDQIQSEIAAGEDPSVILIQLIILIAVYASNENEADLAKQADALQVSGDVTLCNDDIQDQIASGSDDPNTVHEVALETDCMMASLNPETGDLVAPLGETTCTTLYNLEASTRGTIYDTEDTDNNPEAGSTYYFTTDPNDTAHMQSFGQMQELMSDPTIEPDPSDPTPDTEMATDAAQLLTNNYNESVTTTQSVQAAFNVMIQQLTTQMNLEFSFNTNLIKEQTGVTDTAVQNMG